MIKDSYAYHIPSQFSENSKIASFDIDYTVIKTASGRRFPKDKTDWIFFNEYVVPTLQRLYRDESYNIVFFTNQNLERKPEKQKDFLWKLSKIIAAVGIPIGYVVSIRHDQYRKPMTGMFDFISTHINDSVDMVNSFYCGDAAGRPGDFASSDLFFAMNCDLNFYVPEDIFRDGPMNQSTHLVPERPFLKYLTSPKPPTHFKDLNKVLKFDDNKKHDCNGWFSSIRKIVSFATTQIASS